LFANAPNPFRESTSIGYSLPWESEVELRVYDVLGRVVATLESGTRGAGRHSLEWNARGEDGQPVAAGIYFYELNAGGTSETRKMIRLE
jgi:flagellar hook assembly protein FlgD